MSGIVLQQGDLTLLMRTEIPKLLNSVLSVQLPVRMPSVNSFNFKNTKNSIHTQNTKKCLGLISNYLPLSKF